MSAIFPGNYVAHLNAYREQGALSIPGVEFYRGVGALVVSPDVFNKLDTSGQLPALTDEQLYILSPDLRQDDKPRLDKPFVIPQDSVVYRTAISAPGLQEATVAGSTTITVKPSGTNAPASGTLTAEADGFFPVDGVSSALEGIVDGTALSTSADTAVTVTTTAPLIAKLNPSAGAGRNAPSAIIVEVCYYRPAPAPDAEDAHIPYAVEAGSGT